MAIVKCIPACLLFLFSLTIEIAAARPSILSAWQTAYPASDSGQANCQLCHQNRSGGNGWNPYGWNVRQEIRDNSLNNSAAFAAVEALNSDGSFPLSSNVDEISGGTQPGWTLGLTNTIFFKDNTTLANQAPPSLTTPLDLPEAANVPIHPAWVALLGIIFVSTVARQRSVAR